MTENDANRRWLVTNRLTERPANAQQARDAETLLYYQSQLEAELNYVRRQLVSLGIANVSQ